MQKKPKAPKAPKWKDGLSPKQITEAERLLCTTLAGAFPKLASIYEEADYALINADIPQGNNIVEIETEGPLFAIDDIGGENRDWVMKQSPLTYLPVMRALYSTVKLKREIEDAVGIAKAEKFYENLKVALRFYDKYEADGGSFRSGDERRTPSGHKKTKFLGTFYLGPLMNTRRGSPTIRDLIAQVYQWYGQASRGGGESSGGNGGGTDPDKPPVKLTEDQVEMLNWFNDKFPEIAYVSKYSKRSDKTNRKNAAHLESIGFASRPNGKIQGHIITDKGKNYLKEYF